MIDKDGKYTYSAIESITIVVTGNTLRLINNTGNNLLFLLPQVSGKALARLVDLQGRVLWQQNIAPGQLQLTIPAGNIAAGSYFIQYTDSKIKQSQQVVVQH